MITDHLAYFSIKIDVLFIGQRITYIITSKTSSVELKCQISSCCSECLQDKINPRLHREKTN